MDTDERLMFHLVSGYLRRWCLWHEAQYPSWAVGEEMKWQLFQNWKQNPVQTLPDGSQRMHPMSEFTNWPYWMILDLARYVFKYEPFDGLLAEPDQLKEAIVDVCDDRYSNNEQQTFQQAMQ